jgi:hypothetical protein
MCRGDAKGSDHPKSAILSLASKVGCCQKLPCTDKLFANSCKVLVATHIRNVNFYPCCFPGIQIQNHLMANWDLRGNLYLFVHHRLLKGSDYAPSTQIITLKSSCTAPPVFKGPYCICGSSLLQDFLQVDPHFLQPELPCHLFHGIPLFQGKLTKYSVYGSRLHFISRI